MLVSKGKASVGDLVAINAYIIQVNFFIYLLIIFSYIHHYLG